MYWNTMTHPAPCPFYLNESIRQGRRRLDPRFTDLFCRQHRGAARRILFAVVMKFYDLGIWQPLSSDLGKVHHQHGSDRKIRNIHAWRLVFLTKELNLIEIRPGN